MATPIISTIFVLIICVLAYRANRRFQSEARIPMQWGFTGEVNWSAPRRVAFAFMPILAFAFLGFHTLMSMYVPPRVGQEDLVVPVAIGMGAMLVAVQLFHFWLIEKTLRRKFD